MPDPASIEEAARLLASARQPLVIARAAGRDPDAVAALVAFAEAFGAPVVDHFHTHVNFPQDHALLAGVTATADLESADLIVVSIRRAWFPS
jgi:acetolactate synthase-1/2/3 large subunit